MTIQEQHQEISLTPAGRVANGERPPNWVSIKEEPAYTPRKLKIICVGAGFSGLTLAYKIKHELRLDGVVDYTIYDKNSEIGGTWTENRYPGVRCDVPAHAYTFLFEPNADWSQFYAPGAEIQEYIVRTVRKWNLDDQVQLNSKVVESIWNEDTGKWKVKIDQNGTIKEDEAEILVNATGHLNNWKWPEVPGLFDFKGKLVHTAAWDTSYDWENKRVAVIGNGSSGIQCVANMHSKVSKLVNYVRSPTWIAPNFCFDMAKDGKNFDYSPAERQKFKNEEKAFFDFRKAMENSMNGAAFAMLADHPFQHGLRQMSEQMMKERLQDSLDPTISSRVIPTFKPGCRRLTPGDGYLEAFSNENTTMNWDPIEYITEKGIKTRDGVESEFDLIVCATGFNTRFQPRWKLIGREGCTLDERWKNYPEAFFSMQVDGMPNYFMIDGPGFPTSHGSLLTVIDFACDYIIKWTRKIATEDIKSIDVTKESLDDYNVWAQEYLKRTAWADTCRSGYKSGHTSGQVSGVFPGTTSSFKTSLERIGGEHFHIKYNSANRFRFLGNGQLEEEKNGLGDLAGYFVKGLW